MDLMITIEGSKRAKPPTPKTKTTKVAATA